MNMQLATVVVTTHDQFRLIRAWPKDDTHVLLELENSAGHTVAGQWFAHPDALAAARDATPAPAFTAGNVLVQPDGADAKLRSLPGLLNRTHPTPAEDHGPPPPTPTPLSPNPALLSSAPTPVSPAPTPVSSAPTRVSPAPTPLSSAPAPLSSAPTRVSPAPTPLNRHESPRNDVDKVPHPSSPTFRGDSCRKIEGKEPRPGAPWTTSQLISHRPSRRAVVRHVDGEGTTIAYTKVVRASRAAEIARRGQLATALLGDRVATPRLQDDSDVSRGILRWSVVPGKTLADLGNRADWSPERAGLAWRAAGEAIATLHSADTDAVGSAHSPIDELRAIENWLGPAVALGLLESELVAQATSRVAALLLDVSSPSVKGVLHRDLHDKQILIDDAGRVGLIDVDTLAVGERALDVANLLVHLDLRELQGGLRPEVAAASRRAFLTAVGAADLPTDRLNAHAQATRLRLAGVYAFRPRWRDVARHLLHQVATQPGAPI